MSLESFRIQPLRLDHIDAHIPDRLIAHELDSAGRILRVQLTDGGDVRDTTGTSLSLAWKHQRGASGLEPFSLVDAATGVYEVTYPSAMMLDGVATCSIQVTEGSSIAATRNFHVRIQDAPIDGDATASTETWTALQLVLTQGQTAVTALEEQHTEHATAHSTQMQQQASEFSTAQSTRADEFTGALTDYQAQVDAAAASATEVYIGMGTPPENAVLWIDTTDGGKRVKSLVDGQWVDSTAEVMRPLDADTLGGLSQTAFRKTSDAIDALTFGGQISRHFMRYLPGSAPANPINGFDANTVDLRGASLIPMYNGVNTPTQATAVLETIPYSNHWAAQYFHEISSANNRLYRRSFIEATTWTAWVQL